MNKIGFIGLGVMGGPMAGHLSKSGFQVSVFNRTYEKSSKWTSQYKGMVCDSLSELGSSSEFIILCVRNDQDVKNIINGKQGIIDSLKSGTIIIDHTTTSADLSKKINELLLGIGCFYIDAPISGGQLGAESGTLSIMAGGDKKAFNASKKFLRVIQSFISIWAHQDLAS